MAALGIGLAYAGYTGVLWGVLLVTGKNVSLKQLFGSVWPPVSPGVKSAAGTASQPTGTTQAPGTTTAAGRGA